VAGAKQPHHSNSTQPPLASGTADGPFQDRSPRRRFCLSTRTLRAIKNVLWLTRLQSASTGCDSYEYRHHHSTSEVAHSMVPQCGTVAIPSTINDCVRAVIFSNSNSALLTVNGVDGRLILCRLLSVHVSFRHFD